VPAAVPVEARDPVGEAKTTRPVANAAELRAGSRSLDARSWSLLRDPDEDRFLTALFAHLAPIVATLHSVSLDRLGVKPADMIADTDPRPFARSLQYAAKMMGMAVPDTWVRYDQRIPVVFANVRAKRLLKPAFFIGTPVLGDRRNEIDLVFQLVQPMVWLQPGYILRLLLKEPALVHLTQAALALADESSTPSVSIATTRSWLRTHLSPLAIDQIITIAKRLRAEGRSIETRVADWLAATERTAARVALLLAGDLPRCTALVEADREPAVAHRHIVDLAWFSITDDIFAVRQHLQLI
jgi:hypothetical protein